jgi:hypothetical protein
MGRSIHFEIIIIRDVAASKNYEVVCLNVYSMLLNSATAEDGHELLFKKSVLYIVYRYNSLETSDSFIIKNLQEHGKLIDDHKWNREKI